jgi:N-acetylglutamate synthase-like GNAT family acetyltransferase
MARIYIESWNAGFGELLGRPNRRVTAKLIERLRLDLPQGVPHRWWVAERKGAIVGFAGIGLSRDPLDPKFGELNTIAVDPVGELELGRP